MCDHDFYYSFSKITFKLDMNLARQEFNFLFLSFKEVCDYVVSSF